MSLHRRIVTALVVAGLALTTGAVAQQPAPPITPLPATPLPVPEAPLTVDDAVALALRQNPTVVLAGQDVLAAQAQVEIARANRRPTVDLNVTSTFNPSPTSIELDGNTVNLSQTFSTSAGVVGSVPVWPTTRWRAPIAGAQAGVGASQESLLRTRQQVAFAARQRFFQVLSAQELLTVAQEAERVAQEQLRLARNTVEAGLAAPLDVFQAQAALANAQVNRERAENTVNLAEAALATQLGLPAGTPLRLTVPGELPAAPADVAPLVQQALTQRPELTQLNFRRAQVRATIEQIRLQRRPLVNLQANYNKSLSGSDSPLGGSGLTISAVAALNLYDGGRTDAQVAAAEVQLAQLDTNARQIELGITLDVRQAWLDLRNATQQLEAAEAGRRAAAEALRIAQIRYENGEGIVLEVEQARLNLAQASTALAQARFQALESAAALRLALGEPAP